MITLKQFAKYFQDGLNVLLPQYGLNNAEFVIFDDAGKYLKAVRSGNIVNYKINGLLSVSTSANDANNVISMGVNGLILTFLLPLWTPRTTPQQTSEDLQPTEDNRYVFAETIRGVIDTYFQKSGVTTLVDKNNTLYSVSYKAGTAATGSAQIRPGIGNSIEYSTYIEVTFAEGGVSSKEISITIDGSLQPFQSVRFGRSPVFERNVFSYETRSTCFSSSTVFAVDIDLPLVGNTHAQEYLAEGELNTIHFVNIDFGKYEKKYIMTFGNIQETAKGTAIAGINLSLMEIPENPALFNVPSNFSAYRFKYETSEPTTLSFNMSGGAYVFERTLYVSGVGFSGGTIGKKQFELTDKSFVWDEDEQAYFVYLIMDTNNTSLVQISDPSAPMTKLR